MAVITSAGSGNFSSPATWVGGIVPGAGDDAVAAHTVTFDADVTVISFQQSGTGKFLLGNGRTVTGNVIANAGTFTSGGTIEAIMTTTATINGNVTGVSSTAVNIAGVVVTGLGTLTINGSITGSAGNASSALNGHAAVYTNVNSTIIINGAVMGGAAHKRGFQSGVSSDGTFTVFGNVIAGTGLESYGALTQGSSAILNITGDVAALGSNTNGAVASGQSAVLTITGNVWGASTTNGTAASISGTSASLVITGNVTAGSGSISYGAGAIGANARLTITGRVTANATANNHGISSTGASSTVTIIGSAAAAGTLSHGVNSSATANGVVFQGDMTDSQQGAVAVYTRIFRMTATNSGVTRYATSDGSGSLVSRVSPDNATGVPDQGDVRGGTLYGYNNELSGSLTMPPVQAVKYGVPVGNTTGTGEFDLGRAVMVLGEAVAAGMTTGSRQ